MFYCSGKVNVQRTYQWVYWRQLTTGLSRRWTHCWNLGGLFTGPDGWTNYDNDSSLAPNTDRHSGRCTHYLMHSHLQSRSPFFFTLLIYLHIITAYTFLTQLQDNKKSFVKEEYRKRFCQDFGCACLYRTAQSQEGDWYIHWLVYNLLMGVFWEFHACYIITIPFIHKITTLKTQHSVAELQWQCCTTTKYR